MKPIFSACLLALGASAPFDQDYTLLNEAACNKDCLHYVLLYFPTETAINGCGCQPTVGQGFSHFSSDATFLH